ncbi:MAG: hypothetical protein MUD00_00965 [Candidatus Pacebacteria bacterium]|jgi:hypothetical protein|nr:hypothetical protein [Candidatus Paceibacterota bacterium]
MKNLNNIIKRSNLTPLERVTMLVHNGEHRQKTGKDMLSEAELNTLTQGWAARLGQANEYNKYLEIAKLENSMRIDATMFSYRAELSLVRHQRLLSYCLTEPERMKKLINDDIMDGLEEEECLRFALAHTYLEYGSVLHLFTFFNLPREIREDLALLDDSVAYSNQYLGDEVQLYEMFNARKVNNEDKDTLVDIIFSRIYYEGINKMRGEGTERDAFILGGYFAEFPLSEAIYKTARDLGIKCKNRDEEEILDDIESYAKEKAVTMEHLIKESLRSWLDDGLFTKQFAPIFMNGGFDTVNGITRKNHKKLFEIWYAELEKSKRYFNTLFRMQKLKREEAEITVLGETKTVEKLTGESLYTCQEDLEFVREYKKQVYMILPFSNLALFIEKHTKPIQKYTTLCQFRKLGKRASDTFDANFTEEYDKLIESYREEMTLLNHELAKLTDVATEHLSAKAEEDFRCAIQIWNGSFRFDLREADDKADIIEKYERDFRKVM